MLEKVALVELLDRIQVLRMQVHALHAKTRVVHWLFTLTSFFAYSQLPCTNNLVQYGAAYHRRYAINSGSGPIIHI